MTEGGTDRTSGETHVADIRWSRRFWILLGAFVVIRAIYAAVFPLDLAPDESYYWDWGRQPALGYYSKPPMIGLLMAVAGVVGRDSMFILKFFPSALTALGVVFVFLLGRAMYGARAGFWGAALLLATPGNAALNTFFTIDPPLFLFSSASLWFAWRWWTARGASERWAVALTLSLGCGYLTKQIQLVFPALWLAFLATVGIPPDRRRRAQLLGILLGSLMFLVPPLVWNWQHDWITLRHTAEELESHALSVARSARFVGEFLGGQAGLGGGITWLAMLAVAVGTVRRWTTTAQARDKYLVLFFAPGFTCFLLLATLQRVEQNWPLMFYTSAAVLVAGWAFSKRLTSLPRRLVVYTGVVMGGLLAAALMAVPFVVPHSRLAGERRDPTARLRGWKTLADEVQVYRTSLEHPDSTFLLAPDDRYVASALAYYLPDQPRIYAWEDPERPESQYGIWGRPTMEAGRDGLVIGRDAGTPRMREVTSQFASWERLGEIRISLGGTGARDRTYEVFLGRGFGRSAPRPEGGGGTGESR